jgi:hypothetical protein
VKRQFSLFFGIRRPRGGQLIKEQMVILARDYDEAVSLAYHYVKHGEDVLSVVDNGEVSFV